MILYYYLATDQRLRKQHAHVEWSGEKRPWWGVQTQTRLVKWSLRSLGDKEQKAGRYGERSPRSEEKRRNSPTLVRASTFSLLAPNFLKLSEDVNRRCDLLIKLIIVVQPQSRANCSLRCPRQTKVEPEGFLVSVGNWSCRGAWRRSRPRMLGEYRLDRGPQTLPDPPPTHTHTHHALYLSRVLSWSTSTEEGCSMLDGRLSRPRQRHPGGVY